MSGPAVMLASTSVGAPLDVIAELEQDGTWWFEAKFDGIRAVVTRTEAGEVRITNRRRADITHRYPDVVAALEPLNFVGVLDGEIICLVEGRPNFGRVHTRDAQSAQARIRALARQMPATFVPFDVLELAGKDVRSEPYTARRMRLGTLFAGSNTWSVASQDGSAMWSVVQSWNLEGLVAKLGTASYVPTRSKTWRKIKATKRVVALVTGTTKASGGSGRAGIGALEVALFDPEAGALVPIGKVGSGMSAAELRRIDAMMKAGQFVVVEVEYLEVNASGAMRMPVFKSIRDDVPIETCTIDTLRP